MKTLVNYSIFCCCLILSLESYGESLPQREGGDEFKAAIAKVREGMADQIKDAKKCGGLIQKYCGTLGTKECMKKKSGYFPTYCREQLTQVETLGTSLMGSLKPCMDKAMTKCSMPKDIEPSQGIAGLKGYQDCLQRAMSADSTCKSILDKKVKSLSKDFKEGQEGNDPFKMLIN